MKAKTQRALGGEVSILTIAYAISAAASFLLTVVIGRVLGAAALGTYTLASSVGRIFYAGTDLGVAPHLTRAISRDRATASPLLSLFVSLRLALIPVALVIAAVVAVAMDPGGIAAFCVLGAAMAFVSIQVIFEAVLQAHGRQVPAGIVNIVTTLMVVAGIGVWFIVPGRAHGGLVLLLALYAAMLVLGAAVWAWWAHTRLAARLSWRLSFGDLRRELGTSWPIGLSFLLGNAALRAPSLVLGSFGTTADVGAFAAVDMFITAAAILQSAVTNATFPRLSATYRTDPAAFRRVFWTSNLLLAAVGLAIGAFLVVFGADVIAFVFPGKDFARISSLTPIVGWSTPVLLLVHHNIFVFAAADSERRNLRFMLVWFVVIAGAQLALVPAYGLLGAGWALLIGRVIGLAALAATILGAGIHRGGEG